MSKSTSVKETTQNKPSAWKTVKRLVRDLKPIAWAIAISGVVCICSVALISIAPEIVSIMTDMIYDFGDKGTPIDIKRMGDLAVYLALAYVGGSMLEMAMAVLMTNIASRFYTKGLRIRISDKIRRLPVSFVDNTPNGEIGRAHV